MKLSNQRELPSLKSGRGQMVSTKSDYGVKSKRIEIGRDTATNLPVLAECNWRFSVVEVDNSIVPKNSPKSKPLIGATRELLLFTIASTGADQSEDWIVGSFWGQRNCCHPLPH